MNFKKYELNKKNTLLWKIITCSLLVLSDVILILILWKIINPQIIVFTIFVYTIYLTMSLLGITNLNKMLFSISIILNVSIITFFIKQNSQLLDLTNLVVYIFGGIILGVILSSIICTLSELTNEKNIK